MKIKNEIRCYKYKRVLFTILFAFILITDIIILIFQLEFYIKTTERVEKIPSNYHQYALENETCIQQNFWAMTDFLESVYLVAVNYEEDTESSLYLRISDMNDTLIYEKEVPLNQLFPGDFYEVKIKKKVMKGRCYKVELSSHIIADTVPMIMTINQVDDISSNGSLYLNGEKSKERLVIGYCFGEFHLYGAVILLLKTAFWTVIYLSIISSVFFEGFRYQLKKMLNYNIISQWIIILGIIAAFLLSALLNGGSKETLLRNRIFSGLYVAAVCIFSLIYIYRMKKFPKHIYLKKMLYKERGILIVLLLSLLLRIGMIGTMQRWDAMEYYYRLGNACRNFTFTWDSFWENFRLANHTSLGFSLVMAIGEFLNIRGVVGVQIVNLVLTLGAIYCIYELLRNYWLHLPAGRAAGLTFLISVTPLFLGTFAYINVDYVMAVFFIYMIYADYKQKYVLLAFWTIMMIQTKEPAMIIAFCYYLSKILVELFMSGKRRSDCIAGILQDRANWAGAVAGIAIIINMILQERLVTWG